MSDTFEKILASLEADGSGIIHCDTEIYIGLVGFKPVGMLISSIAHNTIIQIYPYSSVAQQKPCRTYTHL